MQEANEWFREKAGKVADEGYGEQATRHVLSHIKPPVGKTVLESYMQRAREGLERLNDFQSQKYEDDPYLDE